MRALAAFSSATDESFVYSSFLAWRARAQDTKRRKESLAWCLERMALSQTGLLQQAICQSWYHLVMQNRQPAWALNLQKEMQNLMRHQNSEPNLAQISSPKSQFEAVKSEGQDWLRTFSLATTCLLLGYFLSAIYSYSGESAAKPVVISTGITIVDSDGDGIADQVDRCPLTAKEHKFRSSWQTDWDADGCMDSLEDVDDDNDFVINSKDLCPRTLSSDGEVDQDGCSWRQRDLHHSQSSMSGISYKVVDSVFEVTVGAIFTTSISYVWSCRAGIVSKVRDIQADLVLRCKSR